MTNCPNDSESLKMHLWENWVFCQSLLFDFLSSSISLKSVLLCRVGIARSTKGSCMWRLFSIHSISGLRAGFNIVTPCVTYSKRILWRSNHRLDSHMEGCLELCNGLLPEQRHTFGSKGRRLRTEHWWHNGTFISVWRRDKMKFKLFWWLFICVLFPSPTL